MLAMSEAVPTGYSGMKPLSLRKPKLYEQFNIPQYASPRPSTRSLPVSSAAATNIQGPSKNFLIRVSGVSGPKFPKKTTSALQPAFLASSTALTASFSFSTVTLISLIFIPLSWQALTTAARRRSDSERIKQSLDTAITPRFTLGIFGSIFLCSSLVDFCSYGTISVPYVCIFINDFIFVCNKNRKRLRKSFNNSF